jgi:hypothetical protein
MKKLIALQPFLEACGVDLDKLSFQETVAIALKLEHQLDIAIVEIVAGREMQD